MQIHNYCHASNTIFTYQYIIFTTDESYTQFVPLLLPVTNPMAVPTPVYVKSPHQ